MPLSFLPQMKGLRSLHFTGFSVSSPESTLELLNRLPFLEEVTISGPPPGLTVSQRSGWGRLDVVQSMTPMVLSGLRPLKSFSICEARDPFRNGHAAFFTTDMIHAVHAQHAGTLQRLELTTDIILYGGVTSALAGLVEDLASICDLRLGWPNMDKQVLEDIPEKVQLVEVPAAFALEAGALSERLLARSGELKHLKRVSFGAWTEGSSSTTGAMPYPNAKALKGR